MLVDNKSRTLPPPKPPRAPHQPKPEIQVNEQSNPILERSYTTPVLSSNESRKSSLNSTAKMEDYFCELLNFGKQMKRQLEVEWNNNIKNGGGNAPLTRDAIFSMTASMPPLSPASPSTPSPPSPSPLPSPSQPQSLPPPSLPKRTISKNKKEPIIKTDAQKKKEEEYLAPADRDENENEKEKEKVQDTPGQQYERDMYDLADEKRNADFHELFKSVPEDDHLIEDYNCAMYRDIMIQGRLYISEHHLCFYAKFFSWVTNLIICFDHVLAVERKTMVLVVPNGIQINTETGKHVFASFMTRDFTFKQIEDIWKLNKLIHQPKEQEDKNDCNKIIEKGEEKIKKEMETTTAITSKKSTLSVYAPIMIALDITIRGNVEKLNDLLYNDDDFIKQILSRIHGVTDVLIGDWKNNTREILYFKDGMPVTIFDYYKKHEADEILVFKFITIETSTFSFYTFLSQVEITNLPNNRVRLFITFHLESLNEVDHSNMLTLFHLIQNQFTYYAVLGNELNRVCLVKDTNILEVIRQKLREVVKMKRDIQNNIITTNKAMKKSNMVVILIFLCALMIHFFMISHFVAEISNRVQSLEERKSLNPDYFGKMQYKMEEIRNNLWELSRDTHSQKEIMLFELDQEK